MSTTPDTARSRADDQLVTHLSHWLTRQLGNDELLRQVQEIDTAELPPGGRAASTSCSSSCARPLPASGRSSRCSCARRSRRSSTATNLTAMFTGLIREVGDVVSVAGGEAGVRLVIAAPETAAQAALGDSVAIDGVCLTVVAVDERRLALRRRAGDARAHARCKPSSRGRGSTSSRRCAPATRSAATTCRATSTASAPCARSSRRATAAGSGSTPTRQLLRYVVEKGSIAVQGTSLTVAAVDDAGFAVALIPHTLDATTLGALEPGDPVNLEADVLAKYVEKLLAALACRRWP